MYQIKKYITLKKRNRHVQEVQPKLLLNRESQSYFNTTSSLPMWETWELEIYDVMTTITRKCLRFNDYKWALFGCGVCAYSDQECLSAGICCWCDDEAWLSRFCFGGNSNSSPQGIVRYYKHVRCMICCFSKHINFFMAQLINGLNLFRICHINLMIYSKKHIHFKSACVINEIHWFAVIMCKFPGTGTIQINIT